MLKKASRNGSPFHYRRFGLLTEYGEFYFNAATLIASVSLPAESFKK
jgi:hypothetical protein